MQTIRRLPIRVVIGLGMFCLVLLRPIAQEMAEWLEMATPRRTVAPWLTPPPPRTPFDKTMRNAWLCRVEAQSAANQERERLEEWDPAGTAGGYQEPWRLQLLARDPTGGLRRAREAVRGAAALARTQKEKYRAAALLALIEHESGHHDRELEEARRLTAWEPQNPGSLMILRRAANCTGRLDLAQKATDALQLHLKPIEPDAAERYFVPGPNSFDPLHPIPSGEEKP